MILITVKPQSSPAAFYKIPQIDRKYFFPRSVFLLISCWQQLDLELDYGYSIKMSYCGVLLYSSLNIKMFKYKNFSFKWHSQNFFHILGTHLSHPVEIPSILNALNVFTSQSCPRSCGNCCNFLSF